MTNYFFFPENMVLYSKEILFPGDNLNEISNLIFRENYGAKLRFRVLMN